MSLRDHEIGLILSWAAITGPDKMNRPKPAEIIEVTTEQLQALISYAYDMGRSDS